MSSPSHTWHLRHSDHQILALLPHELVASQRLKRRQVGPFRSQVSSGALADDNLHWRIPVDDIDAVIADNAMRRLVVLTKDEEIELRGFGARGDREWVRRWDAPDQHDPLNPGSPVSRAADQIAKASGLELASDPRAEVLHYRQTPEQPTLQLNTLETVRVRPWLPSLYVAFGAIWLIGWYLLMGRWLIDMADNALIDLAGKASILLSLAVVATTAVATTASAIMVLAMSITVDSDGIRGVSLIRRRTIHWPHIALIHSAFELGGLRRRRRVQIVKTDGSAVKLPPLTAKQVSRLAEAMAAQGRLHGINVELPPGDFTSRYAADRSQVPSAIAIEIFWWKL